MGKGLQGVLSEAQAKGSAVGHFNVSDVAILKGVIAAAQGMNTAVIVGVVASLHRHRGWRSIGEIEGDEPTWMAPMSSKPCL